MSGFGPEPEPIVYVVDDDEEVCEALRCLLVSKGLRTETYTSAEAFLAACRPGQPGCLVLDVRMRGMSGLELHGRLAEDELPLPVIIITGHGDISMAVRAIKAGAVDFLEKPVSDTVLVQRIRAALELDARNRRRWREGGEISACLDTLTDREREVMELVIIGRASKRIAAELGIAEKTVEAHRKHVLAKLGVHSAVELVRIVLAHRARESGARRSGTPLPSSSHDV